MKVRGEEIKRLIPQREPFIMVDEIEATDGTHAVSALAVRSDNYFMLPDGTISETSISNVSAVPKQAKRCVPPSNSGLLSAM